MLFYEVAHIPFTSIDWGSIPKLTHKGDKGTATWQSIQFKKFRVRLVEYSKEYFADHWCEMGHIVHCIGGTFKVQLSNGTEYILRTGDSFIVSDGLSSHRLSSVAGASLLIVDGEFLKAVAL